MLVKKTADQLTTKRRRAYIFENDAAKIDQGIFEIPEDVILSPGEAIIITAESTANSDIAVGLSWKELL